MSGTSTNESRVAKGKRRHLDDEEIDSGDDENRDDRAEDAMDVDGKRKKVNDDNIPVETQDFWDQPPLGRSEIPISTDGEASTRFDHSG